VVVLLEQKSIRKRGQRKVEEEKKKEGRKIEESERNRVNLRN
jgi:hypothetical protein